MRGNLLEFPAMGADLRSCILKMSTKLYTLIFSISTQNHSDFSDFSENSCAGMAIFAISKLLLTISPNIWVILTECGEYSMYSIAVVTPRKKMKIFPIIRVFQTECGEYSMYSVPVMSTREKFVEFPDYSGVSIRIWRILDVFGICSRPCCILLKNKTSLGDFPDYSGYSQGKTQNYM